MKAVLTFPAVALVALTIASAAAADQRYSDPRGDAGVATDLVALAITSNAAGTVSFSFTAANPLVANHAVFVAIDADRNAATGEEGFEYEMFAFPSEGRFLAWDGSTYVVASPPSFRLVPSGNVQQFFINRADIGNTSGFNFVAFSISIDGSDVNVRDRMPDSGVLSYKLSSTTSTTVPKSPADTQLVARIVYATVLGHGRLRTLDVRIRVSERARAQLRLLNQGFERLQKIFGVKPGANELKAPIPDTLTKGVYQLEIRLADAKGHQRVYRATVLVPA